MTLAVDARALRATLWLIASSRLIRRRTVRLSRSDGLLPACAQFLEAAGKDLRQLQRLIVVVGPGMFSTLRASVVAMKALAAALGLPLAAVRAASPEAPVTLEQLRGARVVRNLERLQPDYGQRPRITIRKTIR